MVHGPRWTREQAVEYIIQTGQTFQQVLKTLVSALEDKGFTVRQSFDLQSALWDQAERETGGQTDQGANYCVLMVESPPPAGATRKAAESAQQPADLTQQACTLVLLNTRQF